MTDEANKSEKLDNYLSDPLNLRIYQNLEQLAFFKPLWFFKFFYELVALLEEGKSQAILDRLNELNLTDGLKTFVIFHLLDKYIDLLPGVQPSIETAPPGSLFLLEQEYQRLESLGPDKPEYMFFYVDSESPDIRARAIVSVNKVSNEAVEKMMRKMWDEAEEKREIERLAEMRGREAERERIDQTILQEIRSMAAGRANKNPEFTTNRQVIALCYMLKHLQVKNVDKTVQAQFIEFLTGKNYKKIYDSVREADQLVYLKNGEDAKYVKEWFEKLGITEIVKDLAAMLDRKS
jgi:hypothetical protein